MLNYERLSDNISKQIENDRRSDNLSAFVEVWLSRRYGITSKHMEEGERAIREQYKNKIIGGIDFGRVYDEFPIID